MTLSSSLVSRTTLDTGWRVREVPRMTVSDYRNLPWIPAQVPGHVHLDLMRAGVISDPFDRLHERAVEWVDAADWVYETTFQIDDLPPAHRALVFHGLDTIAEIELNGEALGQTDNMLIAHRFSIDGLLKVGENTLTVTFRSAQRIGHERQCAWDAAGHPTMPANFDGWSPRCFVRKAQYMYGWDWGPVLCSAGIWQPVELVTAPVAEITDFRYAYDFSGGDNVAVTVTAEVERFASDIPLTLRVSLGNENGTDVVEGAVPAARGAHHVTLPPMNIRAKRWQPQGQGDQVRYPLTLGLTTPGEAAAFDESIAQIGFRSVELVQEPDADGQGAGFKFRINGRDVFIKGANWIPEDSFPSRITPERLRQRITQARDAGCNMLRIWGGGLYESEDFYTICDELGIMVWQDFLYGCAYYPDTGEYASAARREAELAVRRIRKHPSLAFWCGNNENLTMYEDGWGGVRPPRYLGEHLYNEILPAVVAAEDPQTPYWASSPMGGERANSDKSGDCHNWDVWHGRGDWVHYTENDARFCSEFGFGSSCGLAAWDTCLAAEDRAPHSAAVRWHDKTRKGYDTYLGMVDIHFPVAQTLEDLVYYTQCNQAEAMKFGVEHYRRRKGHNWGTLIWQLNDCWPVQSWSLIDSLGEPKLSYYASKRFYAPLLLSMHLKAQTVEVHLVNDTLYDITGDLTLTLRSFDGIVLRSETKQTSIAANVAALVHTTNLEAAQGREQSTFLHAQFVPTDGSPAENVMLLAEPKDLPLSVSPIKMEVERSSSGAMTVTLSTDYFAPYVWLYAPSTAIQCSDNGFHLLPGVARTITVTAVEAHGDNALADTLSVRTLTQIPAIGKLS